MKNNGWNKYYKRKFWQCCSIVLAITALIFFSTIPIHFHNANAETISPLLTFGSLGSGPGQFNVPRGIAVDNSGNIYVADDHNNRIEKFNPQGTFLLSFSPVPSGIQGGFIEGVTVDGSDNIYVTPGYHASVYKFNSTGTLLSSFIPRILCNCTLMNASGTTHALVQEVDDPSSIAIDISGNIYVETINHIDKFSSSGTFLSQFFATDTYHCCLSPAGIAIDSSNNIYIADMMSHAVVKLNSTGSILSRIGSSTLYTPIDNSPQGVAVDSSGNIYVADTYNGRIVVFNSTGSVISSFGISGSPVGIVVDKSGKIYVTDVGNDRVDVFSTSQLGNGTNSTNASPNQSIQLNSIALSQAVSLAENSPQFQSLVHGYNYTFSGDFNENGPIPQGGIGLTMYGLGFDLYRGPSGTVPVAKVVEVFIDPTLTQVLNVTVNGASYMRSTTSESVSQAPQSIATSSTNQTDFINDVKEWSESSSISDVALLNEMNMNGTHIPSWFKKMAGWVVDGQISQDDFINAIKYMDENGIIK